MANHNMFLPPVRAESKNGASVFQPNFCNVIGAESERLEEYGRFQQHVVLLEDEKRISAYLAAISQAVPGDVVVDIGAGTGILGIVALKCGFGHAFLIEPSRKMALYARHLARLNGVHHRVTVLESKLELLADNALPGQIDLVVTETLSSVLFGFGSWDALPALARRVRRERGIIPLRGKLYSCLAKQDYASRNPSNAGFELLKRTGIEIDLFERTFRSGGNVYDKSTVLMELASGMLIPACIAHFDFLQEQPIVLDGAVLVVPESRLYTGLLLYWEVDLCEGNGTTRLSSMDQSLSSWYPFYVPFSQPLWFASDEAVHIRMLLSPIDSPYKYAFRFVQGDRELTNMLYW